MDPKSAVVGFIVGILVGMTGVGAGSLMTPLLIVFLHYKARMAIGSDLAYSAVMKACGAWQHGRAGNVDVALSWRLAAGSIPASLLGVWWSHSLQVRWGERVETVLMRLLGGTLIFVAVVMIIRLFPKVERRIAVRLHDRRLKHPAAVAGIGFCIGFLVGVTSVGSGALFGVALLLIFGLGTRKMVGTDLYHAALLSTAATIGQAFAGNINYPLAGSLLVGAAPGIILGSRISLRLPETVLQPTLATVLLLTGLKII